MSTSIPVPGSPVGADVAHPDPDLERGDMVPLVTRRPAAVRHDRAALARDAPSVITKGSRHSPGFPDPPAGLGADEASVLLDAPTERGLDRGALLRQVVAVEAVVDL
jgi:hypothetical protein